jgi:3-methyl-2-oxobutanoate hydroxymethyltransferase
LSPYASSTDTAPEKRRLPVTVPDLQARKPSRAALAPEGTESPSAGRDAQPIVMVTAYDAVSARVAEAAGVDIVLVGDSLGMVVLGYETTLQVTIDDMVRHTAAVTRCAKTPLVVADMPYLSFHVSPEETVKNAGRLIVEGGAAAVKIEGGAKRIRMIEALLDAEIPVMGHIGLTPQSVNQLGGFKVQGKAMQAAERLLADAKSLEAAGVFSIVLECVPYQLAALITRSVDIPTIGIGAGPYTDGQVLVFHDILGMTAGLRPKFVRRFASLEDEAVRAVEQYKAAVVERSFPELSEAYSLPDEVARALEDKYGPIEPAVER